MSRSFHFDTFEGAGARLVKTPSGNNSTSSSAQNDVLKDVGESTEKNFILVWEFEVEPLTDVQRLIFFWVTICIAIIALLGNLLVIYVNISR